MRYDNKVMGKFTYKNVTSSDLTIIGVGVVKADGIITVDEELNNPNLKLVTTQAKEPAKKDESK